MILSVSRAGNAAKSVFYEILRLTSVIMDQNNISNHVLTFNLLNNLSLKQNFQLVSQGSEAKVYKGDFLGKPSILKERFIKKYRHPELDKTLSYERIRAEVRALNKCHEAGIKCPAVYFADLENRCIVMQEITNSITVKEYLKSVLENKDISETNTLSLLAQNIGSSIAKMHKNELVHGDITTSNMLLKTDKFMKFSSADDIEVYFIDFGLAKRDIVAEDKAIDLYVLERVISSSHPNSDQFYAAILEEYMNILGTQSKAVADKLEEVRSRGRKRTMVG